MRLLKQYPVLSYYVVTFTISWVGVLLVLEEPTQLVSYELDTNSPEFMVALLVTLSGPPIAGLLLTAIVGGREGFRGLRSRLLKWRVAPHWYAIAFLAAPLSVSLALFVLSLFSADFRPGYLAGSDGVSLPGSSTSTVAFAFIAGIFTGFMEELGWTGFAIPRLNTRYGILRAGLVAGFLWGAWHFVSNLVGSGENSQGMPLGLYMAGLLFTFLPPFRVLMVWLYAHTESLLLAMLMHASLVTFWLISTPEAITGPSLIIWYATWGALLWMAVAAMTYMSQRETARHRILAAAR
jgi:membrane protease YdiL (CAAX protease family)